jgi:hypothetical protein
MILTTQMLRQQTRLSDLPLLNSTQPGTSQILGMSLKVYAAKRLQPTAKQIFPPIDERTTKKSLNFSHRVALDINVRQQSRHTHTFVGCRNQVDKYLPAYPSRGFSKVWRMLVVAEGRTRGLEKRGVALLCCCTRATVLLVDVVAPLLAPQLSYPSGC